MALESVLGSREGRPLSQASLDAKLRTIVAAGRTPGIAVAYSKGGDVVSAFAGERAMGRDALSAETRFTLGCLIKPVVALVCCQLHCEGVIDLDGAIEDYLPELANPRRQADAVLLRHLLSHTAGYVEPHGPDARWRMSWDRFVEFFRDRPMGMRPGSVWSYTQSGHSIAAEIIKRVTGQELGDLLTERFFLPAGIADWQDRRLMAEPHVPATHKPGLQRVRLPPDTGFYRYSISDHGLTIDELLRLASAIAGTSPLASISSAALDLFGTIQIEVPVTSGTAVREYPPSAYGLGLAHYGAAIGHNGSLVGSTCAIRFDRDSQVGVAVAANAWNPGLRDRTCSGMLARLTGDGSYLQGTRAKISRPLRELEGEYRGLMLGLGQASLRADGDRLRVNLASAGWPAISAVLSAPDGYLRVERCTMPSLAFSTGTNPQTDEPYLFIGMSAYVRCE